ILPAIEHVNLRLIQQLRVALRLQEAQACRRQPNQSAESENAGAGDYTGKGRKFVAESAAVEERSGDTPLIRIWNYCNFLISIFICLDLLPESLLWDSLIRCKLIADLQHAVTRDFEYIHIEHNFVLVLVNTGEDVLNELQFSRCRFDQK